MARTKNAAPKSAGKIPRKAKKSGSKKAKKSAGSGSSGADVLFF